MLSTKLMNFSFLRYKFLSFWFRDDLYHFGTNPEWIIEKKNNLQGKAESKPRKTDPFGGIVIPNRVRSLSFVSE